MNTLAGPVGIAKMVGGASEAGLVTLLTFVGGSIDQPLQYSTLCLYRPSMVVVYCFVLIEAVIRRPLNYKFQYWANSISFLLLRVSFKHHLLRDIFR